MKRLIPTIIAALAFALAGCQQNPNRAVSSGIGTPTRQETLALPDGTRVSLVDNSGKVAAEEGRIIDTNAPEWTPDLISAAFPSGLQAPDAGLTYFENSYTLVDEGNRKEIEALTAEEKGIREELSLLAKSGTAAAQQKYVEAAARLAEVGGKLIEAQRRVNSAPKGDRVALVSRGLSVGPGHEKLSVQAVDAFGRAVMSRHTNQNTLDSKLTSSYKDTTNSKDVAVVTAGLVAIYDEPDKESDEAGRKHERDPDVVNPPVTKPGETSAETFGPGALARVQSWYPGVSLGGGNNDAVAKGVGLDFLWKPVSDSNGKLAIHTPNTWHVTSISFGGETKSSPSGIGNGYRPLWRFDKAGGAYGGPVPVVLSFADGTTATINVPDGAKRFTEKVEPKLRGVKLINDGPIKADPVTYPDKFKTTGDSIVIPKIVASYLQRDVKLNYQDNPGHTGPGEDGPGGTAGGFYDGLPYKQATSKVVDPLTGDVTYTFDMPPLSDLPYFFLNLTPAYPGPITKDEGSQKNLGVRLNGTVIGADGKL